MAVVWIPNLNQKVTALSSFLVLFHVPHIVVAVTVPQQIIIYKQKVSESW